MRSFDLVSFPRKRGIQPWDTTSRLVVESAMPAIQGNNSEFSRFWPLPAKIRPKNICEFSSLRGSRKRIPCATEQGINSTTTGNLIRGNSELIRPNRESARNRFSLDGSNDSVTCQPAKAAFADMMLSFLSHPHFERITRLVRIRAPRVPAIGRAAGRLIWTTGRAVCAFFEKP
jgi:hypothetical protein